MASESVREWLDAEVKAGYGAKFASAFEEVGIEDTSDLQDMDDELMEELEFLGHKVKPQEAALIIWEVDDDADDCVDWEVSHEPTRAHAAASLSSAPALGSAGVSDDVLPDSGRHHRLRASQAVQRCAACRGAGLPGTGLAWHGWEAGFGQGAPSLAGVLTAAVDAVPAQWSSS